jgi:hypothetical protein
MEALILFQLKQAALGDVSLIDLIDPEFAAFPGVRGDGRAVLAGDGDAHWGLLQG